MSVPVAFSTGSLHPFGLDRVYGWAAQTGFDGVEVMMDERWDTHQHVYINELSERHGLPVLALHPPIYRGAWRLDAEETLVRSARLAGKIGGAVVVAHPPPPGIPLSRWRTGTLAKAREAGVPVAVENMPKNFSEKVFSVRRKSCYRPEHFVGIGDVTLDTSHVGASGIGLMEFWTKLGGQLRHVHLSDSDLSGGDQHRLPGKGKLPLREFLAEVGRSDYPGAISLELKPWPLGTPHTGVILERMKAALEFTRDGLLG